MDANSYSAGYYKAMNDPARSSAHIVVPIVLELTNARQVVDIGCGDGTWLSVFQEHGIEDICGIDGPHVDPMLLQIPPARFIPRDLTEEFRLDRRFDLVLSLEVAEHLPPVSAEKFVRCLTQLGPVVVFSAAIPGQGGRHHVNEQWPEYWAELFARRDYVVLDCLRRRLWRNSAVAYWYAQNMLLFVERAHLKRASSLLQGAYEPADTPPLSLVHPRKFMELIEWCRDKFSPAES